jgi:uncharacterized protein (TIGR02466 family)
MVMNSLTGDPQIFNLFPTPLVAITLKDADALNAALKATILKRSETHPSVQKTNLGGWQSDLDFPLWSGPEGAHILETARNFASRLTLRATADGKVDPFAADWKMASWANVNTTGDANDLHTHAGAFWSGCYYVDTVEVGQAPNIGGEFEVFDPRGVAPILYDPMLRFGIKGCTTAGMSEYLTPKSGQMFFFPSWLFHAVRRYKGGGKRISVAFNLSV